MLNSAKPIIALALCALAVCASIFVWHLRVNSSAAALGGASTTSAGDNENYADKLARYRAGAEAAARAACTNEVIGLRGIISLDVQTYDDNFMSRTASATVEYVNQIGGVDRTNIELKFDPGYAGVPAWLKKS